MRSWGIEREDLCDVETVGKDLVDESFDVVETHEDVDEDYNEDHDIHFRGCERCYWARTNRVTLEQARLRLNEAVELGTKTEGATYQVGSECARLSSVVCMLAVNEDWGEINIVCRRSFVEVSAMPFIYVVTTA